jgi:hypothetical protein
VLLDVVTAMIDRERERAVGRRIFRRGWPPRASSEHDIGVRGR